jgi:hypothetical protein
MKDSLDDVGTRPFDGVCRKPHEAQSQAFKQRLPSSICLLLVVVNGPVDFNNEALSGAEEVHHERPDWLLPPKSQAADLAIAQYRPQEDLGSRLPLAQAAGNGRHPLVHFW